MATTLPPSRKPAIIPEAEIEAVINKGGSIVDSKKGDTDPNKPKHINIRLNQEIVERISSLRSKRPRNPGSPKLGISLHDWIVEAVLDKLDKES